MTGGSTPIHCRKPTAGGSAAYAIARERVSGRWRRYGQSGALSDHFSRKNGEQTPPPFPCLPSVFRRSTSVVNWRASWVAFDGRPWRMLPTSGCGVFGISPAGRIRRFPSFWILLSTVEGRRGRREGHDWPRLCRLQFDKQYWKVKWKCDKVYFERHKRAGGNVELRSPWCLADSQWM